MPLLIHLLQNKSLIYFSKTSILYINKKKTCIRQHFFVPLQANLNTTIILEKEI